MSNVPGTPRTRRAVVYLSPPLQETVINNAQAQLVSRSSYIRRAISRQAYEDVAIMSSSNTNSKQGVGTMEEDLPKNLTALNPKIIRVRQNSKKPLENNWTARGLPYNHPAILAHDGNLGVLTGDTLPDTEGRVRTLCVLDADNQEFAEAIQKTLPRTFVVVTGSGGKHFYFTTNTIKRKIVFTRAKKHYGELQHQGQFVVAPNSIHPVTLKPYEVIIDEPIANIELQDINSLIQQFKDSTPLQMPTARQRTNTTNSGQQKEITETQRAWLQQHITSQWKQLKTGVWQGPHPVHGSSTGTNCKINLNTGEFCCFRCGTGGGWLTAYAVFNGMMDCSEAYEFHGGRQ